MPQNSKMLIGALVAAALAFAVYYGLISQQAATNIQNQTNQSLGTAPASQQAPTPAPQAPAPTTPTTPTPTTQTPAPPAPAPVPAPAPPTPAPKQ